MKNVFYKHWSSVRVILNVTTQNGTAPIIGVGGGGGWLQECPKLPWKIKKLRENCILVTIFMKCHSLSLIYGIASDWFFTFKTISIPSIVTPLNFKATHFIFLPVVCKNPQINVIFTIFLCIKSFTY